MTRNEKLLAAVVIALAVALPVVSRYSFRVGYSTAKEIWRGSIIVVPPPGQCPKPPAPPKGASVTL